MKVRTPNVAYTNSGNSPPDFGEAEQQPAIRCGIKRRIVSSAYVSAALIDCSLVNAGNGNSSSCGQAPANWVTEAPEASAVVIT